MPCALEICIAVNASSTTQEVVPQFLELFLVECVIVFIIITPIIRDYDWLVLVVEG